MGKPERSKGRDLEQALAALHSETGHLEASRVLRRLLPPEDARRALELRELRGKAYGRLPCAERLMLTAKGLEQATRERVAAARANRIAMRMPGALVLDATAGVGADSLAVASRDLRLLSADLDPVHAACSAENLRRAGHRAHVVVADAAHPPASADVLLVDPDRRPAGRRELDPERWSPPLSVCLALAERVRGACFKLAPALDVERVAGLAGGLPCTWQWISCDGELVEVALWTGELASAGTTREVLALRGGEPAVRFAAEPLAAFHLERAAAERVAWIAEPDPALIRSGLLTRFARENGLAPLGPEIAYLGADEEPAPTPLLSRWRVVASESPDRKRVRALLREHGIGEVVVKKRGHPRGAVELVRDFKGKGAGRGTLIVTRLAEGHRAYLVEPA